MSYYRRGRYREAVLRFRAALEEDSAFALAALFMGDAKEMVLGGVPGVCATLRLLTKGRYLLI